ncbi:BA75_00776T0 [Komagataella pastoris]|uniref:Histone-lysine N-methyltransferase, H3 lysine-36 specific n=1 Tax=Komagataella pastoris TaxID=4922 RepID=A0A1B2J6X2_PICPA|nr:BA75_00776T0 [Komagataella pastoris]
MRERTVSDEEVDNNGQASHFKRKVQIYDYPADKTDEALTRFKTLFQNSYQNKSLGNAHNGRSTVDGMSCDCEENWDTVSGINNACGEYSECINRLTSIECMSGTCSCGDDCQNQRFQKRQYAPIAVFETERKGYGVRAQDDIKQDAFIYEYLGEVIDESTFRKRKENYDNQGLEHFYFMMLQKGEFIDATAKGGLGRFCNHSCRPNAYVDKWEVGNKLRMGIFAKRDIYKGEEICFDYNVDRYGANPQKCYCGEDNCIGFLGGRTQTDSANILPVPIAEALGSTNAQEQQWVRSMKEQSKSIKASDYSSINEDYVNSLEMRPIADKDEASKVTSALLKTQDYIILRKLIERVSLTKDSEVLKEIVRLRGYQCVANILTMIVLDQEQQQVDVESFTLSILDMLESWPNSSRNRISSSQIESVLESVKTKLKKIQPIGKKIDSLLDSWSKLEISYKIPKSQSVGGASNDIDTSHAESSTFQLRDEQKENNVTSKISPFRIVDNMLLPEQWRWAIDESTGASYYYNKSQNITQWDLPPGCELLKIEVSEKNRHEKKPPIDKSRLELKERQRQQEYERVKKEREREKLRLQKEQEQEEQRRTETLKKIIANAEAKQQLLSKRLADGETEGKKRHKKSKKPTREQEWNKLFATVVPNMIKKHESQIGRDNLKHCAKDIVHQLSSKEIKKDTSKKPPKELSSEKKAKVKAFVGPYMEKYLDKWKAKHERK